MTIIHSRSEYEEKYGSYKGFYQQYDTAVPITGKEYLINKGCWMQAKVKIVFNGEGVALGVVTEGLSKGDKFLFYSEGEMIGWRYKDSRSPFRLRSFN